MYQQKAIAERSKFVVLALKTLRLLLHEGVTLGMDATKYSDEIKPMTSRIVGSATHFLLCQCPRKW